MDSVCGNCQNIVFYEDESIQCEGPCRGFYHRKCVEVTETEYSNYFNKKWTWVCGKTSCVTSSRSIMPPIINKLNELHHEVNVIGALAPEITKIKAEVNCLEQNPQQEKEFNVLMKKVKVLGRTVSRLLKDKVLKHSIPVHDQLRQQVGTLVINETPYDIYKGENVIGRDELSDIVLRSNLISNKHAVIEAVDWETHLLYDCGSTNKTRLGQLILKPDVRYNLQDGSEVIFANFKAEYSKLKKPENDDNDEDNVSHAGSESILNSAPVDPAADLDIKNNDQPSQQAEDTRGEIHNGSNLSSDLNESSFLEGNKQKASSSNLEVVCASDDSTDDEVDFIPPSQTVKEFSSKRQLALRGKCVKYLQSCASKSENSVLNTQEQEMMFMSERPDINKISNSQNVSSQSCFSSEVQEPLEPKVGVSYDPSIFEAETQTDEDENPNVESKKEYEQNISSISRDIFDAETEIPELSDLSENVNMSNLELSKNLTESSESTMKRHVDNQIETKNLSQNMNMTKSNLPSSSQSKLCAIASTFSLSPLKGEILANVKENKNLLLVRSKSEIETRDISTFSLSPLKGEFVAKLEESPNLNLVSNKSDIETRDISNFMTQPNPLLNNQNGDPDDNTSDICTQVNTSLNSNPSQDSADDDISDICTQVNSFLKAEPTIDLDVKREIMVKTEPNDTFTDDFGLASEETQLNIKLDEKSKIMKNTILNKISYSGQDEKAKETHEAEETQPNLCLYSLETKLKLKEDKEAKMSFSSNFKNETIESGDSDNTDIESDCKQPFRGDAIQERCVYIDVNSIVEPPTGKTNDQKSQSEPEMDEKSNHSESILLSMPAEQENQQSSTSNCKEIKDNKNNESKPSETLSVCDKMLKAGQPETTAGEMDICSTVGNGTYLSTCGSVLKAQSSSKEINNLKNICPKPTLNSKNLFLDRKETDKESLNQSMVFNEPCGTSTPCVNFAGKCRGIIKNTTNQTLAANQNTTKTPPREVLSPDLPCTNELVELANETPEKNGHVSKSCSKDIVPLSLQRTPRARKLSKKVNEILNNDCEQKMSFIPPSLIPNINNVDKVVNDSKQNKDVDLKRKLKKRKAAIKDERNKSSVKQSKDSFSFEILKQNDCTKNLSISLTDINTKIKLTGFEKTEINKPSPPKKARNLDVLEKKIETSTGEKTTYKPGPLDKNLYEHVNLSEINVRKSGRRNKRPKVNENLVSKRLRGEKNTEKHDQSNEEIEYSKQDNSCTARQTNCNIKEVFKDKVEASSSKSPDKNETSDGNTRKSNRKKKGAAESLNEVGSLSEMNIKKSKSDVGETSEAKIRKSNRRKKKEEVKPLIKKDFLESVTKIKSCDENHTCNSKNERKVKGRILEESIDDLNIKRKSQRQNVNQNFKNFSIVDDHQEVSIRSRNPTRTRVKPSRFRETNDKDGSDSSCSVTNASTSQRGKHAAKSVGSVNSTMPDGDNTKINEETSYFIAPPASSDVKKHSELFKTPDLEDRSRPNREQKKSSRSRSRSDSSQSSIRSSASSVQSPRRTGAKGKCVLFTSGLINPTWESQVKKLGGSVVDCPVECSLLVSDKVRRTVKFLCVLGQGKPIVSPDWLIQSWRCTNLIDPMENLLVDKEAEEKYKFSLPRTIQAAKNKPLLNGYHIHATTSVRPSPDDIKRIVESCGGKYLEKVPSKWPKNSIIISDTVDNLVWNQLKVKGTTPPIVAVEMLLIGVLQHKLEIEPHRLA